MAGKLNRRKAATLLEQARLHQTRSEWTKVVDVLAPVVAQADIAPSEAFGIYADALRHVDRVEDARAALDEGLERFADEPALLARMGSLLVDLARPQEGMRMMERARKTLGRDPAFLVHLGFAQLRAGKLEQAWATGEAALQRGGQDEARLLLAAVKCRQGDYAQADTLAAQIEERAKDPAFKSAATSVRADARLFRGDAQGALEMWKGLREAGHVEPGQLGHMAYAAQVAGDAALAEQLIQQRLASRPTAEDRLLFAQIFVLRGEPAAALPQLEAAEEAEAEHYAGFLYDVKATRGRALRLLGKNDEARAVLDEVAAMPEHVLPRLGARVRIDQGHLAAEQGDFVRAEAMFQEALALDPDEPEAKRALELTSRKVAWKHELEAGAEAKVAAARAEAEALERRFRSRESELNALRRELERVKAAQEKAEASAAAAKEQARAAEQRAREEAKAKLAEELATRELEIEAKADEAIERALEGVRCPDALVRLLKVAERTFQKALYTELPAAAVAVLYSGALERALFSLFVERFEKWLDEKGRRAEFLSGATRERRGKRAEYFDHFVEAFDPELRTKAPSMGEVVRALERRNERYLAPFAEFLSVSFVVPEPFFDALAEFVQWSKEKLRDPSAHGRGIEIGYDELKRFRDELLFDFRGGKRGALSRLLESK